MKQTLKQYWINQISHQLYVVGTGFNRHYYVETVLPKLKIDTLKEFYHKCNELDMMRSFNEGNAKLYCTKNTQDTDWTKVRKINSNTYKKKLKLVKEILR